MTRILRLALTLLFALAPLSALATEARLFAREEFDKILLADWKSGKPVQPRPTDGDDVADNGARASSARRPVCWETGRL